MHRFFRLGGKSFLKPPSIAHVQTDGSFKNGLSRTAVILQTNEERRLMKTYIDGEHKNSTESEWASILDGIIFSRTNDQGAVELENDNLGVVHTLKMGRATKEMDRYYSNAIAKEVDKLEWISLRWIPREYNRADRLFRGY